MEEKMTIRINNLTLALEEDISLLVEKAKKEIKYTYKGHKEF